MKKEMFNQSDYEIQFQHGGGWMRSRASDDRFSSLAAMKKYAKLLGVEGSSRYRVKRMKEKRFSRVNYQIQFRGSSGVWKRSFADCFLFRSKAMMVARVKSLNAISETLEYRLHRKKS